MSLSFPQEAVDKATRLVMHALNPHSRPAQSREYQELLREYVNNHEVREAARTIASAMGVQLRDDAAFLERHGLVPIPVAGSPFAPTLSSFRGTMGVADRLGYGILFFVVAAYAYPTAEALNEDLASLGHKIRPEAVTKFATTTCEALAAALKQEPHPDEKLQRGFDHLLQTRTTGRSAGDQKNLGYMMRYLLKFYYDNGLLTREEGSGEDPCYYARPHYKLQVRYMVNEAAPALRAIFEHAQLARQNHG
jgi:hypothetical protein